MCVAFNCYTSVVEAIPRSLHLIIDVSVMSAAVASLKKRWHCSENPHFQEEVNADRELFIVCCCCSLYLAAETLPVVGLKVYFILEPYCQYI